MFAAKARELARESRKVRTRSTMVVTEKMDMSSRTLSTGQPCIIIS